MPRKTYIVAGVRYTEQQFKERLAETLARYQLLTGKLIEFRASQEKPDKPAS